MPKQLVALSGNATVLPVSVAARSVNGRGGREGSVGGVGGGVGWGGGRKEGGGEKEEEVEGGWGRGGWDRGRGRR